MEVAASDAIPRGPARLIVLRGNSGAGKSGGARVACRTRPRCPALRAEWADRLPEADLAALDEATAFATRWHGDQTRPAIVDQDTIRRKLLWEHDVEGGVNIGLIEHIVRYTLASDYVVILEGILHAGRYGEMLRQLHRDFGGGWYFLQVSWDETLRRHQTRPQRAEFTPEQMLKFPRADLLKGVDERVVPEHSTAADTVYRILTDNFPHHIPASSHHTVG